MLEDMPENVLAQVAVAETDLEAIVYQKLLREKGIQTIILDADGQPYVPSRTIGMKVECLKIMALGADEERAKDVIRQFEEKKETRIIAKTGGYIIFRCHQCMKYVCFDYRDRGSRQLCSHCSVILAVPGHPAS